MFIDPKRGAVKNMGNSFLNIIVSALLGIARGMAALLAIIQCLLLFAFIYNRIKLSKEKSLLKPLGNMADVNGGRMCVYTGGQEDGGAAYVFLSGEGIISPILDFKSLYSQFSDRHRVAVPESFGYGFSDDTKKRRDIDTLLEETRAALSAAGVHAPYILFPHGVSGIEALYWAKKYPGEVQAIIGLDMSVPADIKDNNILLATPFRAAQLTGVLRFLIPSILSEHHGSLLTDRDLEIYEALICRRAVSDATVGENAEAFANAKKASEAGRPDVPILLFVSNGIYTGYDGETWLASKEEYIEGDDSAAVIALNCDHSVHNFEFERIAAETGRFLGEQ